MEILGLIGMYFDAAVEFVTSHSLLFRLALTILWSGGCCATFTLWTIIAHVTSTLVRTTEQISLGILVL